MTTTIVTRTSKGGRLSIAEMDANFTNLQATADAAAVKATVDAALALKANSSSIPAKVSDLTNDSGFQTASQVNSAIQGVVGAAPAALDTLAEIATQLANDESAAAALTTVVSTKAAITYVDNGLANKVDKITGKGLSTEDYTTAEKTKLSGISGINTGDETASGIRTKLGISTLSGSNTGDETLSSMQTKASITGSFVGTSDAQTLVNKRVQSRVSNLSADSATPSINTDSYDAVNITGQTSAITGFTMTGTPVEGQKLIISITGTVAVAITWGTSFESSTVTLPTTTVGTARLDIGFLYNSATSKWRCVAVA